MHKRIILGLTATTAGLMLAVMSLAQSPTAPVLNQGVEGDRTVSGRAIPDSGPLKIYDISYNPRLSIGDGNTSMDNVGNFAISVKPTLVRGHQIIAEDKHGRSSAPMTVERPASGVGPSQ